MSGSYDVSQVRHIVWITLWVASMLVVAGRAGAQESVHQRLERISPGQVKGLATAPVMMEEFSDFQCSYCGKFSRKTLPRLLETYVDPGQVRVVFRHFAILGPYSVSAAEAAACAGAQGQFWPYHDRLFAAAGRVIFSRQQLLSLAEELRLDGVEFTACVDTRRFKGQVEAETQAALGLGFRGTPGFVINGRPFVGALPYELFQAAIEEALAGTPSTSRSTAPSESPTAPSPSKEKR